MVQTASSAPATPGVDPFQQRVIDATERAIRVLAPAGSGKTETLVRRIARQTETGRDPRRILVLTFDTNANASFLDKMSQLGLTRRPEVRTLNAFGLRILTQHFPDERNRTARATYFPVDPTIGRFVETCERAALMEIFSILKNHLFDPRALDRKDARRWIEQRYDRLAPETYRSRNGIAHASLFAKAIVEEFARFEAFLEAGGIIDFDDQKLRSLVRLRSDARQLAMVQDRYDEVIVDEFQDINRLDSDLIDLVSRKAALVITGDDDQAIYEFRWASPEFLIDPKRTFRRAFTSYELGVNYRCPPVILDHAMRLVTHNHRRVAKSPTSGAAATGSIEQIEEADSLAEARAIRRRIQAIVNGGGGASYREVGVLYRRNAQHFPIQIELANAGIPYAVREEFDLRILWRQALRLLDLSTQLRLPDQTSPPDYRVAVETYKPFRFIPERGRAGIMRAAATPGPLQWDLILSAIESAAGAQRATAFRTVMHQLTSARTIGTELQVIEREVFGIAENRDKPDESPLSLLHDILGRKASDRRESIERLRGFIERAAASGGSGDGVVLSTCHGAKGRQWRTVVLPSCNEGTFPDPQSRSSEIDLEAERRLFYVAMTRAAEHLIIGHAGMKGERRPSRFLYEAGLLERPPEPDEPIRPAVRPVPKPGAGGRTRAEPRPDSRAGTPGRTRTNSRAVVTSRRSTATSGNGEDRLPPVSVVIPGQPAGEIHLDSVAAVRSTIETAQAGGATGAISVHYRDVEATFPLQLGLILSGIGYSIAEDHDLTHSWLLGSLYTSITGMRRSFGTAGTRPEYRHHMAAIRAMSAVAGAHGIRNLKDEPSFQRALSAARQRGNAGEAHAIT
ncbi:MAG TPA: ATP-dependent helicase, partial [Thermomicrobiales bacterium]|nr:ATP-dependent helicase [Thermomicrobiales bacterium]